MVKVIGDDNFPGERVSVFFRYEVGKVHSGQYSRQKVVEYIADEAFLV